MDSAAIAVARDNNIPIRIFSILQNNSFTKVYNNKTSYNVNIIKNKFNRCPSKDTPSCQPPPK